MVAGIFLVARRLRTQALAPGVILADASTGVALLAAARWNWTNDQPGPIRKAPPEVAQAS
jgi:hypothetical protein